MTDHLHTITLDSLLPGVFRGEESSEAISASAVWLGNLSFNRGETILVNAESGRGKTSLCSFIYGVRTDYKGTISFDEHDIATFDVDTWCALRRTSLAYLPQELQLFDNLTAIENIQLKNKLTDTFTTAEIMQMLEHLEIDHKASQAAGLLSVGQQQRVAAVRALCQPFDFLLLDEPVSHLDPRIGAQLASLVADTAAKRCAGIIATSVGNHLQLDYDRIIDL